MLISTTRVILFLNCSSDNDLTYLDNKLIGGVWNSGCYLIADSTIILRDSKDDTVIKYKRQKGKTNSFFLYRLD